MNTSEGWKQVAAVLAREQRWGIYVLVFSPPLTIRGQSCDHLSHVTKFCSRYFGHGTGAAALATGTGEGDDLSWYVHHSLNWLVLSPLSLSLAKTATTYYNFSFKMKENTTTISKTISQISIQHCYLDLSGIQRSKSFSSTWTSENIVRNWQEKISKM